MANSKQIWSFLATILSLIFLFLGLWIAFLGLKNLLVSAETLQCFCPSCPETAFLEKGAASLGLIKVDIQGAVKKPGIYQLEIGQRLADLVASAAGFSKEADASYIAKNLNLSLELKDQDKIYIPFFAEISEPNQETEQSSTENAPTADSKQISINQADSKTLQNLSGIGEARAEAIISNRPYSSLEELVSKKVLSETLFNNLKAQLAL